MNLNCPHISLALRLSEAEGNAILDTTNSWSKLKTVVSMKQPLTSALKSKITGEAPELKYWRYEGSPHNPADEGFVCNEHSVAISFPVNK